VQSVFDLSSELSLASEHGGNGPASGPMFPPLSYLQVR
jgi:hypothetical protein